MNKNISPRQLAFYNALILSFGTTLLCFLMKLAWLEIFVVTIFVFCLAYLLFSFSLKRFVYRKLKLIYKFIYEVKASKEESGKRDEIISNKSIDEVSKDVGRWAANKKDQITNLQKSEQYRKEFLSNLSHELKTPVFSIQSYVETLLDGAVNDRSVNVRFLEKAAKNTDRLIHLLDDISLISEIESNEMTLFPQKFIIQDFAKEVFEGLTLKAMQKQITFHIKKGCEDPIRVLADKSRIHQVLINLFDNAIKYGREGGEIVIGCYNIDEKKALIEVTDDGFGIEEEHLPRVFERFYRTDKARSRKEGGTGLGLAIVKHIIEAHHQTINIRSQVGVGTTFGFTLDLT